LAAPLFPLQCLLGKEISGKNWIMQRDINCSVDLRSTAAVGDRRYRPMRKHLCRSVYLHNNPVERRLVNSASEWPWSSWKFYYREDASVPRMDRLR
jgi:hypothetical protein